ncbi:MAG: hypothetical protein VX727_00080 [Planctomycetota bacterium]|nr:hypothetical protein [Planctomycetota bacterium]
MLRFVITILTLQLALTPTTSRAQSPVDIDVKEFGVGNAWRPGDTIGVRIELTSNERDEASYWVEWQLQTADGDLAGHGRRIALAPGQPRDIWLYGPLQPWTNDETGMEIRVRTFEDGTPGLPVATRRFTPRTTGSARLQPTTSLLGVVGTRRAGIDQYADSSGALNTRPPAANEATGVIAISSAEQLPDRWEGWLPYEAVVWTDLQPELRPSQETALVEWMRRGGQFVIILPEAGNPWNLGAGEQSARNTLTGLFPEQARRDDGVPLQTVLPRLIKSTATTTDRPMTLRVFEDLRKGDTSIAAPWEAIHATEDGRVFTVRRPVGHGWLTLVGLDLTGDGITALDIQSAATQDSLVVGVPEADRFWNRILGRRADTPSGRTLAAMEQANFLNKSSPTGLLRLNESVVSSEIAMSERAGRGLLLAFGLFLAYWLIAVPGIWFLLGRRGHRQYSWLAFLVCATAFTALAWMFVETMQDRELRIRHLTVLDHIPGEAEQRAVSWFSLYTPGYRDRTLELEREDGLLSPPRNRLDSFGTVDEKGLQFADASNITIDLERRPDRAVVPGRGTSMDMRAHWMGVVDRDTWGGLLREDAADRVDVVYDTLGRELGLEGGVISDLPFPLEDVQVTWIRSERTTPRELDRRGGVEQAWTSTLRTGTPLNRGHAWSVGTLDPGERLDVSTLQPNRLNDLALHLEDTYRPPEWTGLPGATTMPDTRERRRALEALSWYHHLQPPAYHGSEGEFIQTGVTERSFGRELDLSTWAGQPALIITGFMPDSTMPTPVLVDGEPVQSTGTTMVRWILPLPQYDPTAFDL